MVALVPCIYNVLQRRAPSTSLLTKLKQKLLVRFCDLTLTVYAKHHHIGVRSDLDRICDVFANVMWRTQVRVNDTWVHGQV